jgi:predicted esterase
MRTLVLFLVFLLVVIPAILIAKELPARTGWLRLQLPNLPKPDSKPVLVRTPLDPTQEVFELYIPPNYDPARSYGLLAWINPDDSAEIPRHFEPLFKEYGFVAISAERIGNNQPWERRTGLLESAILQISETLNLDPTKHIISGFSGGGRTAAFACFIHPEFWKGAISWAGGIFYKSYTLPIPVGATRRGINDYAPGTISTQQAKKTRIKTSFVLITGPNDINFDDSRGIYRSLRQENFSAQFLEQPGLGHEVGSAEFMRKALDFILKPKD